MDKIRGRKRGKKSNKFIIQSKSGSWNKCINIVNKYLLKKYVHIL